MPAVSARCASSVAYSPATEMIATFGSSRRRRAETSERGDSRSARAPDDAAAAPALDSSCSAVARVSSPTSSLAALTATTRSDGPASGTATPRACSSSRLAAVPIPISQPSTPSRPRSPRAMPMSLTLSA